MGLPSWWQGYLTNASGYQITGSSPAALFDWVYNATYSTEAQIWSSTPWSFHAIEVAIALFAAQTVIMLSLAALFTAFAMLTLLALVMLIIGPVCIPFALFAETAFLFLGWVWATATLVLSMLAIDVLLSLFMAVMTALMQALTVTGTPQTDVPSFWGAAIVMGILGWSVRYVPRLMERIGSGVSVGLDYAAYHMSAGPYRDAAMRLGSAPSTMARRWIGM
jgi:type IV secretory pathway VirB6-like protein